MSGGHWNYQNEQLSDTIFDWPCFDYGRFKTDKDLEKQLDLERSIARKVNPLEDKVLSELLYDVFQLLHDYDWYASGDIGKEAYLRSAKAFKKKWLKQNPELAKKIVDDELLGLKKELYESFGIEEVDIDE